MEPNSLSTSPINHRLTKHDRLTKRKHIKLLFEEGKYLRLYPFKVFFIQKEKEHFLCNKVLCSVPKKQLPSAVARNRIKRLLKEAYRLHKHILGCNSKISEIKFVFLIGYVYTGSNSIISYPVVEECVIASLYQLRNLLQHNK